MKIETEDLATASEIVAPVEISLSLRRIKWFRTDLPRTEIDQDILFSLGATLAVFHLRAPDAEKRLLDIAEGRATTTTVLASDVDANLSADATPIDLEQYARDQISGLIRRKFKAIRAAATG